MKSDDPARRMAAFLTKAANSDAYKLVAFMITLGSMLLAVGMVASDRIQEGPRPSSYELSSGIDHTKRELQLLSDRVSYLENSFGKLSSVDAENIALADLVTRQGVQSDRLEAIEQTLDMQPRELIELILLREKVASLEQDTESTVTYLRAELDRVYSTGLTVIGGLLVSVLALLLPSIFRQRNS